MFACFECRKIIEKGNSYIGLVINNSKLHHNIIFFCSGTCRFKFDLDDNHKDFNKL